MRPTELAAILAAALIPMVCVVVWIYITFFTVTIPGFIEFGK